MGLLTVLQSVALNRSMSHLTPTVAWYVPGRLAKTGTNENSDLI